MRLLALLLIASFLPGLFAQSPPLPAGLPAVVSTNAPLTAPARTSPVPPAANYVPFPRPGVQAAPVLPIQRPAAATPSTAPRTLPRPQNPYTALNNERSEPSQPEALRFDAITKAETLKPGEGSIDFTFSFTNVSSEEVIINWVRTSCGCTVAKLPPIPWHIPVGGSGEIGVTMDLRGKVGVVSKMVTVDTSKGPKYLNVRGNIPANAALGGMDTRTRNMELAKVDRQIVFRNDCASCHATPAEGKHGEALFSAACAICHDSPHRATMVPDLRALKFPTTPAYWKQWVTLGRPGSLMPAFDKKHGGILDDAQIESLVEYLSKTFKGQALPDGPAASTTAQPAPTP